MSDQQSKRRPLIISALAVIMFVLALSHAAGVYTGLVEYPLFDLLDYRAVVWLLLIMDGMWAIGWTVMGLGLLMRWQWARQGAMMAFVLYQLTIIIQHGLAAGVYEHGQLPFLFVTAIILSAGWVFLLTRPRIRQAFDDLPPASDSPATDSR